MLSPEQIELLYRNHRSHKFPYADCYRLKLLASTCGDDLIPELDYFFSCVAGFASSAATIHLRYPDEIRGAKKSLSKTVFQACPSLNAIREKVTPERTPDLYRTIEEVEEMRIALVSLLASFPFEDVNN